MLNHIITLISAVAHQQVQVRGLSLSGRKCGSLSHQAAGSSLWTSTAGLRLLDKIDGGRERGREREREKDKKKKEKKKHLESILY